MNDAMASPFSPQSGLGRIVFLALTLVIACAFALPYVLPAVSEKAPIGLAFADDAFYYTESALNFWALGRVSFDGITVTNGVQPLWMLWCIVLGGPLHFLDAGEYLPWIVLWSGVPLLLLFLVGLERCLAYLRVPPSARFAVTVLAALCLTPMFFTGMETPLVFVTLIYFLSHVVALHTGNAAFRMLPFALRTWLVWLARLDMAILLLTMYLLCVPGVGFRRLFRSGLVFLLLCAPYLAANTVFFGTPQPISGEAKNFWSKLDSDRAPAYEEAVLAHVKRGRAIAKATRGLANYALPGLADAVAQAILKRFLSPWAATVTVVVALIAAWRYRRTPVAALAACLTALHVQSVFQLFYYSNYGWYIFPWYLATVALLPILLVSLVPCLLLRRAPSWACVPLSFALVAVLLWNGGANAVTKNYRSLAVAPPPLAKNGSTRPLYRAAAAWLNANLDEGAVVGAWAAGELGYYTQNPVINLEGLAGDTTVLAFNRDFDMAGALLRFEVDYVVQHFTDSPFTYTGEPPAWTIRKKVFVDYPECFSILTSFKNLQRTMYVFAVHRDELAARRNAEIARQSAIKTVALCVPAEDFSYAAQEPLLRVDRKGAHGRYVSCGLVEYHVPVPWEGQTAVFARVNAATLTAARAQVTLNDVEYAWVVPASEDGVWRYTNPLTTLTKAGQVTLRIAPFSDSLETDELYLLPEAELPELGEAAPWLEFLDAEAVARAQPDSAKDVLVRDGRDWGGISTAYFNREKGWVHFRGWCATEPLSVPPRSLALVTDGTIVWEARPSLVRANVVKSVNSSGAQSFGFELGIRAEMACLPNTYMLSRSCDGSYRRFVSITSLGPTLTGTGFGLVSGYTSPVWVDPNYTGTEMGTVTQPYKTLAEGIDFVPLGGTVKVNPGTSDEALRITKPSRIETTGSSASFGS